MQRGTHTHTHTHTLTLQSAVARVHSVGPARAVDQVSTALCVLVRACASHAKEKKKEKTDRAGMTHLA